MSTSSETNAHLARSTIPVLDKEVLDLGVRWLPFGGPSAEEIFVLFGWTEAPYFQRLQALAERHVLTNRELRHQLLLVCRERLHVIMVSASRNSVVRPAPPPSSRR